MTKDEHLHLRRTLDDLTQEEKARIFIAALRAHGRTGAPAGLLAGNSLLVLALMGCLPPALAASLEQSLVAGAELTDREKGELRAILLKYFCEEEGGSRS